MLDRSRLPTSEDDATWTPYGRREAELDQERITLTVGPADRYGKQHVRALLDGEPIHDDHINVYSAYHRGAFCEAVYRKATGESNGDELPDLIWLGAKVIKASEAAAEPEAIEAPKLVRLEDVEPERVEWLWRNKIPIGKVTLAVGDPGLGKSLLALDLAARVSTGAKWPDCDEHAPQGGVVLISVEDDLADTIRPRLDAAGANVAHITAIESITGSDERGEYTRTVDISRDMPLIEAAIDQTQNCRFVVFDPISALLGKDCDSHNNSDVRGTMAPLAELAARKRVAILCVSHLRKGDGRAIHKTMGSIAFVAAARAVWVVIRDPENPKARLLLPVKNNLAQDHSGLRFELSARYGREGVPCIAWHPEPVKITADEAMAPPERKRGPDPEAEKAAVEVLRAALEDGPRLARDVEGEAAEVGIAKRTLARAKRTLGVESFRTGNPGPWFWRLPSTLPSTMPTTPDTGNHGTLGNLGILPISKGFNDLSEREKQADCQDTRGREQRGIVAPEFGPTSDWWPEDVEAWEQERASIQGEAEL